MTPRNLYLLEVALAVAAAIAFVLLASRHADPRLATFSLW